MRHLHPDEPIDLAEGTRPESSAPHLRSCEACRRQLADARAMMAAAADVEVPEPSPLFWDHLSMRVREAIAAGSARHWFAPLDGWQWSRRRLATPLAAGAAVAIVIAAIVTVRHGHTPAIGTPPVTVADGAASADTAIGADDPSLDLVADLAADVDWDAAAESTVTTQEGIADKAVTQLTEAERRELRRLLQQELAHSGA